MRPSAVVDNLPALKRLCWFRLFCFLAAFWMQVALGGWAGAVGLEWFSPDLRRIAVERAALEEKLAQPLATIPDPDRAREKEPAPVQIAVEREQRPRRES